MQDRLSPNPLEGGIKIIYLPPQFCIIYNLLTTSVSGPDSRPGLVCLCQYQVAAQNSTASFLFWTQHKKKETLGYVSHIKALLEVDFQTRGQEFGPFPCENYQGMVWVKTLVIRQFGISLKEIGSDICYRFGSLALICCLTGN